MCDCVCHVCSPPFISMLHRVHMLLHLTSQPEQKEHAARDHVCRVIHTTARPRRRVRVVYGALDAPIRPTADTSGRGRPTRSARERSGAGHRNTQVRSPAREKECMLPRDGCALALAHCIHTVAKCMQACNVGGSWAGLNSQNATRVLCFVVCVCT